ncbi:MAG TPA: DUF2917 domain-containing protein [Noviherbaspirillum sp.]|uniref:DUF2917 domain-containing protein n=1 Tax=Noviherbaspirillum sp. TaxID=1926288 RepID=UPI002D47015C|nr:DUF2917 domain-containing protein [Noviherbaspirillum sp.]HYD97473.1 DUF2917 domain-containing protein [Noviherbaspirillum sp.]
MRGLFTSKTHTILSGQALSGIAERAHTLKVQRGRIWVTVEGIRHDYFLHAGDAFTAIPGKLTVVEADQEAVVALCRPAPHGLLEAAGKWLEAVAYRLPGNAVVQTSLKRHRTCDAC